VVPPAPPSWESFLTVSNDPSQRDRWARLRFSIIGPLLAAPPQAVGGGLNPLLFGDEDAGLMRAAARCA